MKTSSKTYLEPLRQGTMIFRCNTVHSVTEGPALFQQFTELIASDTFGRIFSRRSENNGRTWSDPELTFEPQKSAEGVWRRGESALYFDKTKRRLVRFFNFSLYAGDYYDATATKNHRIFYEISLDGGRSFSEARQLIQKNHTAENWLRDVRHGRNTAAISFSAPIALSDGRIGLPCQMAPPDADYSKSVCLIDYRAGMLIGSWRGDELEWDAGEFARIDRRISSRGLCEPAIARLTDNRLMMVCRGSNASIPEVPGRKWLCLSDNEGVSWSAPTAFAYDGGELFFSPATGSALLRHSRNKKLYWIGNIVPENPNGNSPRYPLVIAEVDEARAALRKKTVALIDTKRESDSPLLQLSNFHVYEDWESGELVVILARWFANAKEPRGDYHCPATEYRLGL